VPKLTPKSIAHDARRGQTYLYATQGKDKLVLALDANGKTRVVRKVTAPSDTFWIASDANDQPCAVFWAIDKTVVFSLVDDKAKAKTIKQATFDLETAFVPEPVHTLAVAERSLYRFDGDRWTKLDDAGEGTVLLAELDGVYARPLAGGDWQRIHAHQVVRACISASAQARRCLVGAHGGAAVVMGIDGSDPKPLDVGSMWCSVPFERGFFAWADYKVLEISFAGEARDTGITADEEAADSCLFRAGEDVLFIKGTKIFRYRTGDWTTHDI